jgi:glutathione peroxidase
MSIYAFSARDIDGNDVPLERYRGKTLLIVNVASRCGFTPQYTGLEALHQKYEDRGFAVLGFPCNQFGSQEPGGEPEIREFCRSTYEITFPLFAKVEVNGANAHPLWQHLKSTQKGVLGSEAIKWNFTKFLVDREGHAQRRFAPNDRPEDLDSVIAAAML